MCARVHITLLMTDCLCLCSWIWKGVEPPRVASLKQTPQMHTHILRLKNASFFFSSIYKAAGEKHSTAVFWGVSWGGRMGDQSPKASWPDITHILSKGSQQLLDQFYTCRICFVFNTCHTCIIYCTTRMLYCNMIIWQDKQKLANIDCMQKEKTRASQKWSQSKSLALWW